MDGKSKNRIKIEKIIDQIELFLDLLRTSGYKIGVETGIRLNVLFFRLSEQGAFPNNTQSLCSLISTIICTTPKEQQDFKKLFNNWIETSTIAHEKIALPNYSKDVWKIWNQGWLLLAIILIAGLVSTWLLFFKDDTTKKNSDLSTIKESPQDELYNTSIQPRTVSRTNTEIEVPAPQDQITAITQTNTQVELSTIANQAGQAYTNLSDNEIERSLEEYQINPFSRYKTLYLLQFLILVLLLYFWFSWWRWRAKHYLKRVSTDEDVNIKNFYQESLEKNLFDSLKMSRTTRKFRQHILQSSEHLDTEATINQTCINGGVFSPIYGNVNIIPEYLVLIDRKIFGDIQAKWMDSFVDYLEANHVFVERFYFSGTPHLLTSQKDELHPVSLDTLLSRFPDHRLILFTDADHLIHPITGKLTSWISKFVFWSSRTVFIPGSDKEIAFRRQILEQSDFIVLPASEHGISVLVEKYLQPSLPDRIKIENASSYSYPSMLYGLTGKWLDRYPPSNEIIEKNLLALNKYLDFSTMEWLKACAVFPSINQNLTIFLGEELGTLNEANFLKLSRLPWFRFSYMPDWLRHRLINELSSDQEKMIRDIIKEKLEKSINTEKKDISIKIANFKHPFAKRWFRSVFKAILSNSSQESEIQDHIFIQYVENPLAFRISKKLHRAFGPQWTIKRLAGLLIKGTLLSLALILILNIAQFKQYIGNYVFVKKEYSHVDESVVINNISRSEKSKDNNITSNRKDNTKNDDTTPGVKEKHEIPLYKDKEDIPFDTKEQDGNNNKDILSIKNYLKAPNPFVYKKSSDLWGKNNYKTLITDWVVFSNRDNFILYLSTNEDKIIKKFKFLDKFKVLQMTRQHLLVEEINSNARGYGRIKEFILLPHAYKTIYGISHKAILINQIGTIKGDVNAVRPLRSPSNNSKPTGQTIRILEFCHIYSYFPNEKNPNFVLLGKGAYFFPHTTGMREYSVENMILGWVPAHRILSWNTREALQTNPNRKHPIYYFKSENDLQSYYKTHYSDNDFPTCNNVPSCRKNQRVSKELLVISPDYEDRIDRTSWPNNLFRYAIIKSNNDINKPFEIAIPSATLDKRMFEKNIVEIIENQRIRIKNRDVVFLIDATMSMGGDFFKLTGNIAEDIMDEFKQKRQKNNEQGKLRFGVALYRDYLNKNLSFEINNLFGFLTENSSKTKHYLNSIKPLRSYEDPSDPAYYPEAVFQGLINTIEQMNWREGSRKLIIHIGDVGNHSRGLDNFSEKDIAKKLVENDISYCALQLVQPSLNNDHKGAQNLFCLQSKSIIIHTYENVLENINQNNDMVFFTTNNISQLQSLIQKTKSVSCSHNEGVCSPVGEDRWLLRCISNTETDYYQNQISELVNELNDEIFEVKSLMDNIRNYKSDKNISSKPFLMPVIVKTLIDKIGKEIFRKKDEPETRSKIFNYIGPTKMEKIDQQSEQQEIIQLIGKEELKVYLEQNVNFITKAYVYFRRPGKQYEKDPDQFIKTILFRKNELERLLRPLSVFYKQYQCNIHPDNLRYIWKETMLAILGEHSSSYEQIDKTQSIKTLYEQQFGLSLRNSHPLLKIKYKDIETGNLPLNINFDELANYLCTINDKLKKIYFSDDNYFRIFGNKYIWIESSYLP